MTEYDGTMKYEPYERSELDLLRDEQLAIEDALGDKDNLEPVTRDELDGQLEDVLQRIQDLEEG